MRKRQRNHHAFLAYPAPTFSEVPQREHQPVVNAGMMGDRKRNGKSMRPPGSTVEELDAELRPWGYVSHELLVQHSQASRFEHGPPDLGMDVRALVVPVPRPHHVAVTEQLDALAAEHLDVTRYQAVDTRKPRWWRSGSIEAPRPTALATARIRGLAPHGGRVPSGSPQEVREVGVSVNDRDRLPRTSFHPVGSITSSRGRPRREFRGRAPGRRAALSSR